MPLIYLFFPLATTALVRRIPGGPLVAAAIQSGPVIKLAGVVGAAAAGYAFGRRLYNRIFPAQRVNISPAVYSDTRIAPRPIAFKRRRYPFSHSRRRYYTHGV